MEVVGHVAEDLHVVVRSADALALEVDPRATSTTLGPRRVSP